MLDIFWDGGGDNTSHFHCFPDSLRRFLDSAALVRWPDLFKMCFNGAKLVFLYYIQLFLEYDW